MTLIGHVKPWNNLKMLSQLKKYSSWRHARVFLCTRGISLWRHTYFSLAYLIIQCIPYPTCHTLIYPICTPHLPPVHPLFRSSIGTHRIQPLQKNENYLSYLNLYILPIYLFRANQMFIVSVDLVFGEIRIMLPACQYSWDWPHPDSLHVMAQLKCCHCPNFLNSPLTSANTSNYGPTLFIVRVI